MLRKQVMLFSLVLMLVILTACSGSKEPRDPAPDFELENLDGETVSLSDLRGKATLIYFYFSHCPDVCLPTTHFLSKVQEELKSKGVFGTKTALVSITFDPERDTRERLKEFSGYYNADYSGWYFLRGEVDYTREVAESYRVMVVDMGNGNFGHSNIFTLVDPDGNYVKYINANDETIEPEDVAKELMKLL